MRSFAAGTVVASRHPGYAEGDKVMGTLGWQQFAISDGTSITRKVKEADLPLSLSLGILGLNGVTAYFGLLDLGTPRPGGHSRCFYCGRCGRLRRRSDREIDGLPQRWHHRWSDEDEAVRRRIRLRRGG